MEREKVLIVEDQVIIAANIKTLLEQKGYEVLEIAMTGEEAIEQSIKNNPDIILMDILLEGEMDGITACEKIRKEQNIPVVYITAQADSETLTRAKKTEPYGFLIKPIKKLELYSAVELALYKHSMEMKLQASEERYRNYIDNAPDAVFVVDIEGRYVDVNNSATDITGYSKAELFEMSIGELVHPDNLDYCLETFMGLVETGEMDIDLKCIKKDNTSIWLSLHAVKLDDNRFMAFCNDISDRIKTREKLELLSSVAEQSSESMIITDTSFKINYINSASEKLFGYTLNEISGECPSILLEDQEDKSPSMAIAEAISEKKTFQGEFKGRRKDGTLFDSHFKVSPLYDSDGKLKSYIGIHRDITESKKNEEKLKFLGSIAEQVNDSIMITDLDYKITYMNSAAEKLFGYTLDELVAETPSIFNAEDDVKEKQEMIYSAISSGETFSGQFNNRRKDGSTFICEFRISPMHDVFGNITSYMVIQRDISERVRLENIMSASEEKFRLAFENASNAVFWADTETGIIINCNRMAEELLEKEKADIIGMHQAGIHPPEKKDFYVKMFKNRVRDGSDLGIEVEVMTKNGGIKIARIDGSITDIGDQTVIQGSFRDITDIKKKDLDLYESEVKYKQIFEHSPLGLVHIDSKGSIRDCNEKLAELIGASREKMLGFNMTQLSNKKMKACVKASLKGEASQYNGEYTSITGNKFTHISAHYNPIFTIEGHISGVIGILEDITEQKIMEAALVDSEEKFRTLTEKSLVGVYMIQEGRPIYVNPRIAEITGYTVEEMTNDIELHDLTYHEDVELVEENIRKRLSGETNAINYRFRMVKKNGEIIHIEAFGSIFTFNGKPTILGTLIDRTENESVKQKIRDTEQNLSLALNNSNVTIFSQDKKLKYTWIYNPHPDFKPESVIGKTDSQLVPRTEAKVLNEMKRGVLNTGETVDKTVKYSMGNRTAYYQTIIEATKDSDGSINGLRGVATDITEHVESRKIIKESLDEKEILLRELHHRVKNNMQVMTGLIGLHAKNIDNADTGTICSDIERRIHSLASIHEFLYDSDNLSSITADYYIKSIVLEIYQSISPPLSNIAIKYDIDDIRIGIVKAIPCGMMINELLFNSFSHAFMGKKKGIIKIGFKKNSRKSITLSIKDNGSGLPGDINIKKTKSIGLKLVNSLTAQLRGKIEIDSSRGTEVTITFPSS